MNPFRVLNVNRDASSKDVVQAAASALRARTFSAAKIAKAQKSLLDPIARAEMAFLYFVPEERLLAGREPIIPERSRPEPEKLALERLSIFD